MKRTSGHVSLGLVLVSVVMGACLTERDGGEVGDGVTSPARVDTPDVASARNVVVSVRTQLERTLGKSSAFASINGAEKMGLTPSSGAANRSADSESIAANGLILAADEGVADVETSVRANAAFRLRDVRSGLSVQAALVGATAAAAEQVGDFTVFRSAYENGAHVLQRRADQGIEDYVYFPEKLPQLSELRYEIALSDEIAGLRVIARNIEMLDAEGTPRLRMKAPYAIDGDGRYLAVDVAIEGCAYDTSVAFPWGRPTTAPGARHCTVHLTWDQNAKAPLVVDPYWTQTDLMSEVRHNATSFALGTNIDTKYRAIVVGGDAGPGTPSSKTTEIFDETTRTWAMGPSLTVERSDHAMINIGPALMVIGGRNQNGPIGSAEKIAFMPNDQPPIPSSWSLIPGHMSTGRIRPVAVAYSGGRVLVTGGIGTMDAILQSVDIFDPLAGGWQDPVPPINMTVPRVGHAAVLVPPTGNMAERVLIFGGRDPIGPTKSIEQCVIPINDPPFCNAMLDGMVPMAGMPNPHANHQAVLDTSNSQSPRVFVLGGEGGLNKVDYYVLGSNSWGAGSPLISSRAFFTVTPFTWSGDHKYLIAGGVDGNGARIKQAEIYDVSTKVTNAAPPMIVGRARHTAVALVDKRILVMGGTDAGDKTAELLQECTSNDDCASAGYCAANGMCQLLKPQGTPCNLETDCWNGVCAKNVCTTDHCVDGVCCDNECTEQCAACNNKPPMGMPGTCSPVVGPPRGKRPNCYVGPEATDAVCGGYCDGLDATQCAFPKTVRCDYSCDADSNTFTAHVCDGKGECGCPEGEKCEFTKSEPCGAYACDTLTKECATSCTPAKDGNEQIGCDAQTAICNIENQCVPSPTQCTGPNTMKLPDGNEQSCGNFQCVGTACLTVCNTAYDCLLDATTKNPLFVCDESRQCVPFKDIDTDNTEVSCSTAPAHESSRFGWLAAVALAGLVAARRNRPRA